MGSLVESIWCFLLNKKFIKRKDLVYGYFTSMYGVAGVLITIFLELLKDISVGNLFIISMIISGIVEYLTSFFLEKVWGIRFWNYTKLKPNLQGRVNLWYLILFGLIGVGWGKMYPYIKNILNFDYKIVVVISLLIFIFFVWNFIMTGVIFNRYKKRRMGIYNENRFTNFLDLKYSDKNIKKIFPTLEVVEEIIIE